MLGLADRKVIVPDAVGAVVGEEEESGVAPEVSLHRHEELPQLVVEGAPESNGRATVE